MQLGNYPQSSLKNEKENFIPKISELKSSSNGFTNIFFEDKHFVFLIFLSLQNLINKGRKFVFNKLK